MKHPFPFDPTYGYTLAQLQAITPPPEPPDFNAFWQQTRAECEAMPLALESQPDASASPEHRVQKIYFRTLGGLRTGAWLVEPRDGSSTMGAVIGHGYGGRAEPEYPRRSVAALYVCAPGFSLSADPALPDTADRHVVHGLAHRDAYLIRHCVAAIWSAARALVELVPAVRNHLVYAGESFGGGLGALALPWEPLFQRAMLIVPTFGHHPLRLTMPCVGSGEAVRRLAQSHPKILDVLPYFDAASAARRVMIPTLAAPACFDPAVPPPGQFAVCNSLAGPKTTTILTAGHFAHRRQAEDRATLEQSADRTLWREAPMWVTR